MATKQAISKDVNQTEAVDAYMESLEHPQKAEIEALRQIILKANNKIMERVKWNAPSFFYKEDMAAFNPRAKGFVQIIFVFYNGDMIHESNGLLEGGWKDRRMARFFDMKDIKAKKKTLEKVVQDWVRLMEG